MEWNNECFEGMTQEDATHAEMDYYDCTFLKCRFVNVVFRQCRFHRCRFSHTMFGNVELANSFLSACVFEDCGLSGVNWGEEAAGGKSPFVKMVRCVAKYLVFPQFKMGKTDFSHSTLRECGFFECGLTEADFRHCVFEESAFQQCDLRKADFREARGYAINVLFNKVGGARFMMPEAMGLLDGLGVEIS